ncbi:hypothetical protein [Micromonospora sp. NPDC023888]|uniref:hypothetical protein n=1 Tax=Micromonospora sp. NPDC023888 TaxID=3155607 RepID=UPI0033F99429
MRSPVNGTAPSSAPGRSAPLAADRLRRLARRVVLFAAAVGAGFLLAALFQGPAAADGTGRGSGAEPQLRLGGLLEPVARLTEAARSDQDRQRAAGVDDRRGGSPDASLSGTIGGVVAARDATPAPGSRLSTGVPQVSVPPSRVDTPGAAKPERHRPASPARAAQSPAHRVPAVRPPADPLRQPALAAPDLPALHGSADTPAPDLITAPLPHLVDVSALPHVVDVVSAVPHVVDIVTAVPIRPVVTALCHVTIAVLPPALDAAVVAATPARPAPPTRRSATVPLADPTPVPTVPTVPASSTEPAQPALAAVRAAAVPPPAAPPAMSVVGPAPPSFRASTGHHAARPDPVTPQAYRPGRPVAPTDQDAAGADNGSPPAPGLVRPTDRQSHLGAGQPGDLVPLLVGSRAPAPIARPG